MLELVLVSVLMLSGMLVFLFMLCCVLVNAVLCYVVLCGAWCVVFSCGAVRYGEGHYIVCCVL